MFIKSIGLLGVLCMIACASSTHMQAREYDHQDYEPKTDEIKVVELDTLKDDCLLFGYVIFCGEAEKDPKLEQANYDASIAKINEQFSNEQLQLLMCKETHKNGTYCKELLTNLCKVSMHLDTRGVIHRKKYCF
jgi:hypothetical protein